MTQSTGNEHKQMTMTVAEFFLTLNRFDRFRQLNDNEDVLQKRSASAKIMKTTPDHNVHNCPGVRNCFSVAVISFLRDK